MLASLHSPRFARLASLTPPPHPPQTAKVQENLISLVYKKCEENGVFLEGTLLKASMTVSGVDCPNKAKPEEIAKMTVQTLQRCVPVSVPGVVFLSGGISEEDASIYLNEINKKERKVRRA